jgi:hypothetical protein
MVTCSDINRLKLKIIKLRLEDCVDPKICKIQRNFIYTNSVSLLLFGKFSLIIKNTNEQLTESSPTNSLLEIHNDGKKIIYNDFNLEGLMFVLNKKLDHRIPNKNIHSVLDNIMDFIVYKKYRQYEIETNYYNQHGRLTELKQEVSNFFKLNFNINNEYILSYDECLKRNKDKQQNRQLKNNNKIKITDSTAMLYKYDSGWVMDISDSIGYVVGNKVYKSKDVCDKIITDEPPEENYNYMVSMRNGEFSQRLYHTYVLKKDIDLTKYEFVLCEKVFLQEFTVKKIKKKTFLISENFPNQKISIHHPDMCIEFV